MSLDLDAFPSLVVVISKRAGTLTCLSEGGLHSWLVYLLIEVKLNRR